MSTPWFGGDRSKGLPVGTRVWKTGSGAGATARFGFVMLHDPRYSQGGFPVRFDDHIWEMLDVSYVEAVTPEREARIRGTRPNSERCARRRAS